MLYLFVDSICTGFAHCIGCVGRALFVLVLEIVIKEMLYTLSEFLFSFLLFA